VIRVQTNFTKLLDPTLVCVTSTADEAVQLHREAAMQALFEASQHVEPQGTVTEGRGSAVLGDNSSASSGSMSTPSPVVLITQFYMPRDMDVYDDITGALLSNLVNSVITEVLLLNEVEFDFSEFHPDANAKIKQIVIGKRLTFSLAFQYANKLYNTTDDVSTGARQRWKVIIANADIYFDDTLASIRHSSLSQWPSAINGRPHQTDAPVKPKLIALSKWRPKDQYISLLLRVESQDAWIFTLPIPDEIVEITNFNLGAPRCDNRLAKIFQEFDYDVLNPVFLIHAIESQANLKNIMNYDYFSSVPGTTSPVLFTLGI